MLNPIRSGLKRGVVAVAGEIVDIMIAAVGGIFDAIPHRAMETTDMLLNEGQQQVTLKDESFVSHLNDENRAFLAQLLAALDFKGMIPFVLSNGYVLMSNTEKHQSGDVVALFCGSTRPMILRQDGDRYRLIGRSRLGGMVKDSIPLKEDRSDIQLITLV
jgi:hypothetical protein